MKTPLIADDAIVLGLLVVVLACITYTSSLQSRFWKRFYGIVPSLLLCYFIPSLLNTFGLISGQASGLYKVASRYLLPASLVLLTISMDFPAIAKLGPKVLLVFLAGTIGVVLGGPVALAVVLSIDDHLLTITGAEEVWRGMATIAGSWIGGGANQAAMKEVFGASDKLFSNMIAVDVLVANLWTGVLLYGAARSQKIDAWLQADTSAIQQVQKRIEAYQARVQRKPTLPETMLVLATGFGSAAIAHLLAGVMVPALQTHEDWLKAIYLDSIISSFFWVVLIATTIGLGLSFWQPARQLEGVGASQMGSIFVYFLVAAIGMQMDIAAIVAYPVLFLGGVVWMLFHAGFTLLVAWLIKAPFFFVAVGSQANIGGAASAPIVASAFHPALASVGVLLAVIGYGLGTYGGWICGVIMQIIFEAMR
ncbi:MAG: DUF819 family protein [Cytophagales bacterium]|nr:DUF819 family protein [Bernardetiaceae bacterium]MDW8211748.1 DUF819 family protein [Cytophagales bacterium]